MMPPDVMPNGSGGGGGGADETVEGEEFLKRFTLLSLPFEEMSLTFPPWVQNFLQFLPR